MTFDLSDPGPFYQLLISLLLGLVVGLQRQWTEAPLGGIRTLPLVTLLGAVCAILSDKYGAIVIALGFAGTVAAIVMGDLAHLRDKEKAKKHSTLVSEFSMLLMFAVGVMVHQGPPWLAAALAGGVAVILQAKIGLHGIVERFGARDIKAIMQFVLISLVILPIVPDETYGPLGVFNPREAWLMVVLIVAISLSGYIAYKFFGERAGTLAGGILGGIISSTATTLTYAKKSSASKYAAQAAIVIALSWTVLYVRVALASLVAAPQFLAVLPPLAVMFLASAASVAWLWRRAETKHKGMPAQENPTQLGTALTFGAIYAAVLLAVAFAKHNLGHAGLAAVAVVSGMTDVDAITLSAARLVATGKLTQAEAWPLIVTGIVSNTFVKAGLVFALGGKALFRRLLPPFGVTTAAGILLLLFW